MSLQGKTNFEVVYEKIRLKRKIIASLEEKAHYLRSQNVDDPDILRLHRNIWDLENEVEKLLAEFRGRKGNVKYDVISLSFDDVMDYIGILAEHGNPIKIKELMNTIKECELTKKKQELYKERKEYLEKLLGVDL